MKLTAGYLREVKQQNISRVLRDIWRLEPVSRIELVEETKLTSGTITNLTQDLLHAGLLKQTELSTGNVGRKRVMLRLDPNRCMLIGIDIGRAASEVVVTDLTGRVLRSEEIEAADRCNPGSVLEAAAARVHAMIASIGAKTPVLGVGLSIPGPMNLQDGTLLAPPNFPHWENYPVRRELERLLGRTVQMNDDARTSALAERWFGYGRKHESFVYVTMGHGIGGGVISAGEVLAGANGLYGQLGHITSMPGGEPCACGNRGCWETIGSIPAILRRWGRSDATIDDFFAAVRQGDGEALQVLETTLEVLQSTLTTLFNVYDPDLIVLGGKLYPYLHDYLPRIRTRVQESVYQFVRGRVVIEPASFGATQSAVGAAALVFGTLMNRPLDALDQLNGSAG